ncbi:MAG: peptidylprolyl isomerase [Culturomica sp.]|jgi:peptidylprolyl isomerase/peptidyl-prolyl cis-trans isomerase B (cyclophilin B)|nr:peptidylprolyl isomerase [Culturomica sp.]
MYLLQTGVKKWVIILSVLLGITGCKEKDSDTFTLETNYGNITIHLYKETPIHRENFIRLAREGYYDGLLFHRVIKDFVIQTGDPASRNAVPGMALGAGGAEHQLEAEILPGFFHRKGVLAMAREGDNVNPERRSSGSHFYIVVGQVFTPEELEQATESINQRRHRALFEQLLQSKQAEIKQLEAAEDFEALTRINQRLSEEVRALFPREELVLTEAQKKAYTTVGGIPHLDGAYTVFGEVTGGMDVVEKIAAQKTDFHNRPSQDVRIIKIQ